MRSSIHFRGRRPSGAQLGVGHLAPDVVLAEVPPVVACERDERRVRDAPRDSGLPLGCRLGLAVLPFALSGRRSPGLAPAPQTLLARCPLIPTGLRQAGTCNWNFNLHGVH